MKNTLLSDDNREDDIMLITKENTKKTLGTAQTQLDDKRSLSKFYQLKNKMMSTEGEAEMSNHQKSS